MKRTDDRIDQPEVKQQGWGWPGAARGFHYFIDGRSLCRKWLYAGFIEDNGGPITKSDCKVCAKKYLSEVKNER